MKPISQIREFFWPLLEPLKVKEITRVDSNDIVVQDDLLSKSLDYALKEFQSEEDRIKTVESKSSLFIGTISAVTTVIIAITTVLVKGEALDWSIGVFSFLLFVLTIYMARTIWFSIKALERRSYQTIEALDFLIKEPQPEYYKIIIAKVLNKIKGNSQTINEKVDNMVMAQEYFKRAIVVVTIYSFVLFLFISSKVYGQPDLFFGDWMNELNSVSISSLNLILIYTLIALSLFLSIRAFRRKKKTDNIN
jgi:hypothetical protein